MHLNLQILKEELAPMHFESHYADNATTRLCHYALPYVPGESFDRSAVYVADADELPENPVSEGHVSLVCVGRPPHSYLRHPFGVIWTKEDISPIRLLGQVTRIFGKFGRWESSVHQIIEGGRQLRDIGLVSEPIFNNPLFLEDSGHKVLFHVTGYLDSLEMSAYDAYVSDYGNITPPLPPGSYLPLGIIRQEDCGTREGLGTSFGVPTLAAPSWRMNRLLYQDIGEAGNRMARLMVDELYHPLTDRDLALTSVLADFILRAMRSAGTDLRTRPNDINVILENLLAHRLMDERRITAAASSYGWDVFDRYVCICLRPLLPGANSDTLRQVASQLMPMLPQIAYVAHGSSVVAVCDLTKAADEGRGVMRKIDAMLIPGVLAGGRSNPYNDLKNTFYFWNQAEAAIVLGLQSSPHETSFSYEDLMLADMLRRVRGRQIPDAFVPRGLTALKAHDERNRTELVALLHAYLDRDRNVTRTARDLYMNRSTCIRHLERVVEVSGLDLDDADVRLVLGIALRLLGER